MLIQFILIAAILVIIGRVLLRLKHGEINRRSVVGWLVIWLVAMIIIAQPDITSFLAIKTGVARGVDLVVYVSIIIIFYLLFRFLLRIEKMEADITEVVRHIALKNKDDNDNKNDAS